jgi:hypothetical protein
LEVPKVGDKLSKEGAKSGHVAQIDLTVELQQSTISMKTYILRLASSEDGKGEVEEITSCSDSDIAD